MSITRRDLPFLLPALAAALPVEAAASGLGATVFQYEELPVKPNGQNKGRAVFDTTTHSGFSIELHMTELGPGQSPHAPHRHVNEEVLMLRRGILDATFGGRTTRLTAGSIIYMESNMMESNMEHGWRNPGTEPAEYFVIALGKGKA